MTEHWGNVPHLDLWREGEPRMPLPDVLVTREQHHQQFVPEPEAGR